MLQEYVLNFVPWAPFYAMCPPIWEAQIYQQ